MSTKISGVDFEVLLPMYFACWIIPKGENPARMWKQLGRACFDQAGGTVQVETLIGLIEDYGNESRWIGHYREAGQSDAEDAAKKEAERLLTKIKSAIQPQQAIQDGAAGSCGHPSGYIKTVRICGICGAQV